MVATSEAHDSGLCAAGAATKRRFASDLLNLTLAAPAVNRHRKSGKDAGEWMLGMNPLLVRGPGCRGEAEVRAERGRPGGPGAGSGSVGVQIRPRWSWPKGRRKWPNQHRARRHQPQATR